MQETSKKSPVDAIESLQIQSRSRSTDDQNAVSTPDA
jgi:hypothetical protein